MKGFKALGTDSKNASRMVRVCVKKILTTCYGQIKRKEEYIPAITEKINGDKYNVTHLACDKKIITDPS